MTKALKESASCYHVSRFPKPASSYKRQVKSYWKLALIAIITLSPLYTLALEDGEDHAHRHHHARLHRLVRRNPEKTNPGNDLLVLNKCDEKNYPYPENWEQAMDDLLDNELKSPPSVSPEALQRQLDQYKALGKPEIAPSAVDYTNDNSEKNGDLDWETMSNKASAKFISTSNRNDDVDWRPPRQLLRENKESIYQRDGAFRMLDKHLNCAPGKTSKDLHWHSLGDKLRGHSRTTTMQLSDLTLTARDGKLILSKEVEWHVFKREDYCVWKHKDEWVTFKVCVPTCTDINPCIRKCCLPWQVIDEEAKSCKNTNPEWQPTFYKSATAGDTETIDRESPNTTVPFVYGLPNCPDKYSITANAKTKYLVNENSKNNFKLLLNGTLVHIQEDSRTYIRQRDFCIDGLRFHSNVFSGSEWDQVVVACEPKTDGFEELRIKVYAVLNFISAIFLFVTDTVYILIWRHQNNIHSWLQFSYATSLFFTFTSFSIVQIWSDDLLQIPQLCKIMGWLSHLTYLSAFFWLTSMNFDLWWRFSRPLRSTRVQTQDKKRKRFLGLAAFSIITPLLISCIGISLDYKYSDPLLKPPIVIPGFGKEKCYFESKHSQIPYLYFPAGILLLVDFIFFASTVLHLRKMHTHTELARTQSTSTMEDKKGVRVIAKLFIVMGVLWIFELLSWICGLIFTDQYSKRVLMFIFTPIDCLNSIQGVLIFFIFICKPNVRNQLSMLFRRDDAAKTWNKQTPLPSETTMQQPVVKQCEYIETKYKSCL